jgi:SHS2 domain-containing protein
MYRWTDHTSEVELELRASSERGLFEAALEAFGELVAGDNGAHTERRQLVVAGGDRAALLVGWLDELTFLADTEGFVPERVTSFDLDGEGVRASVRGRVGEPRPLVKAVTLHRLLYAHDADGWRARVVLDV